MVYKNPALYFPCHQKVYSCLLIANLCFVVSYKACSISTRITSAGCPSWIVPQSKTKDFCRITGTSFPSSWPNVSTPVSTRCCINQWQDLSPIPTMPNAALSRIDPILILLAVRCMICTDGLDISFLQILHVKPPHPPSVRRGGFIL